MSLFFMKETKQEEKETKHVQFRQKLPVVNAALIPSRCQSAQRETFAWSDRLCL